LIQVEKLVKRVVARMGKDRPSAAGALIVGDGLEKWKDRSRKGVLAISFLTLRPLSCSALVCWVNYPAFIPLDFKTLH
jgi:hypothetical protein